MMAEYELGVHTAQINDLGRRISGVERSIEGMDNKLDGVLLALAQKKGERKAIAFVATAAGGVGSFLMSLVLKSWGF